MNHFESKALNDFGMSCSDALKAGIIGKATKFCEKRRYMVGDGWECRANGNHYTTQYQALEAHFRCKRAEREEMDQDREDKQRLLTRHESLIKEAGFWTDNLREARRQVFDFDEWCLTQRDNGAFTESCAEEVMNAYQGMMQQLKP